MATWDGYAKQGDSIKIIAVFPNTYGGFTTGLSPSVTIAMDLAGSALVSGAAMTESTALPGIYWYAYTVPAAGFIYAKATSSAGDSICTWVIGTGTIPDMATATELAEVETKIDTVAGIVDTILADTNELQTNQGNWLTATGFATATALQTVDDNVDAIKLRTDLIPTDPVDTSDLSGLSTFDPATDFVKVITNSDKTGYALANPDLCKADLTTTESNLATLLARLSATRAGYLDYLDDIYANTDSLVALDFDFTVIHEALNTYADSLPPGENPAVVMPPDNTDAVKIYAYCFAKDSNTILPDCNGTLELLLSTEENGKHHKADPESGTYYDDTGELFWLVPPYAKVRVQIPALKIDVIGYTGAGAETLRVDHLYKTPQVPA